MLYAKTLFSFSTTMHQSVTQLTPLRFSALDVSYCVSWQTACCAETSDQPVQQYARKHYTLNHKKRDILFLTNSG